MLGDTRAQIHFSSERRGSNEDWDELQPNISPAQKEEERKGCGHASLPISSPVCGTSLEDS